MKQLLFLITILLSFSSYAQINFEKGYFIKNSDEKIDCLIKNLDWKKNPTAFKYKLSEDGEVNTGILDATKEFGIYNVSKYIKRTVKIDRSRYNLDKLSASKAPEFNEETLFLKVLIEGDANLYMFEDKRNTRYFYNKENTSIQQLIYKRYNINENQTGENQEYKTQLWSDLKCSTIEVGSIQDLLYSKKELINLFVAYNQCTNKAFINYAKKQKKDLFNLSFRPGLSSSSLAIKNDITNFKDVDFGSKFTARFGIEAEFIFPFNKNKWAVIVEPTYRYFRAEAETTAESRRQNVTINYQSIELPVGIRHYFYLNKTSKIFINGAVVADISGNPIVDYETGTDFEIEPVINFAFGAGYKLNDTYSLEIRYQTPRELLSNLPLRKSKYRTLSVVFGYSIF